MCVDPYCRFVCSPVKPARTPLRTPLAARTALMNIDPKQQDTSQPTKPNTDTMKPLVPAPRERTTSDVSDCHLVVREQLSEEELDSIYKTMALNR